jgi:predicted DsbA family dithiol-disulfide isomerase
MQNVTLRIAVVLDFVCPWCFIGTRLLRDAIGDDREVVVAHKPFLLNQEQPVEGEDLRTMLREKFGADPEPMFRRIEDVARGNGIPLDFDKVSRAPNTLPAHTLTRLTTALDTQRLLVDRLFDAYFLDGLDIGRPDALLQIADGVGLPEQLARRAVTDPAELEATRADALKALRSGIHGVPYFDFGGGLAVSGAQPVSALKRALAAARQAATQ